MTQTIDSKVVEMRFDNKQFESNVQASLKSLSKLQDSLDMTESVKGLDKIDDSIRGIDLSNLGKGIETIGDKFSALEMIAIGALMNIGSQAADTAISIVKSMSSIEGMASGWEKYNQKTSSVQTIMAATGKSIEEVDEQLEKLNWFTDETSYKFVDMVNNIGKFTSNGASLEDSVTAMMGISNWAALSGAGINEASRAMYNLSQAMGVGSVKLIDWKSIENANMATTEFKQQVIDTAKAMGTLDKESRITTANFDEYLNPKAYGSWFTSDVLIKVLKTYGEYSEAIYQISDAYDTCAEAMENFDGTGMELGEKAFRAAQEAKTFREAIDSVKDAVSTGWMKTFELIFGNYIEAKKLWTDLANELYDVFAAGGDARNEMLQVWHDDGGQKAFIQGLWNIYNNIINIKNAITGAFRDIFPPMTAEKLISISQRFEKLTEKFKLSDDTLDKLQRTFRGLFAILDIGKQLIGAVIDGIKLLIPSTSGAKFGILDITAAIGDWIVKLDEFLKENETFKKGIDSVVKLIQSIPEKVNKVFTKLTGMSIGDAFDVLKDKASDALTVISKIVEKLIEKIKTIPDRIIGAVEVLNKISSAIGNGFESITGISFGDIFKDLKQKAEDALESIKNTFSGFKKVDTTGLDNLTESVKSKTSPLEKAFDKIKTIFEGVGKALGVVVGVFEKIFNALKTVFTKIFEVVKIIGNAIGAELKTVAGAFGDVFKEDIGLKEIMDVVNGGMLAAIVFTVKNFVDNISGAVSNVRGVTAGIKSFTDNANEILVGVTGVLDGVKDSLEAWQNNLKAKTLLTIAGAIAVITTSLVVLSAIKPEKLQSSLTAITTEFIELVSAFTVMTNTADGKQVDTLKTAAKNMLLISVATLILTIAVKKLASIDAKDAMTGVYAVGALMMALAASAKLMSDTSGQMLKGATGLIAFAIAIRLLVKPVKEIGNLPLDTVATGLISIVILSTTLTMVGNQLSKNSDSLFKGAAGLVVMAFAIKLLVKPIKQLGEMKTEELKQGLIGLLSVLGSLAIFLRSADFDGMGVTSGLGLILLSTSLLIMSKAIQSIGSLSADTLISGLLGIAGALGAVVAFTKLIDNKTDLLTIAVGLTVIAASMIVLSKAVESFGSLDIATLVKGLLSMGVAMGIIAISTQMMPDNLMSIGVGLVLASSAIKILASALGDLGGLSVSEIAKSIVALAGSMLILSVGLNSMQGTLSGATALLVAAVGLSALGGAFQIIGKMSWKGILKSLTAIGGALAIIAAVATVAAPVTPAILALGAAMFLIGAAFLATGAGAMLLSTALAELAVVGVGGVATLVYVFSEVIDVIPKFLKTIGDGILDFIQSLIDRIPVYLESIRGILKQVLGLVTDYVPQIIEVTVTMLDGLLQTLADHFPSIVESIISMLLTLLHAIDEHIEEIAATGASIVAGLLEGIAQKLPDIIQAAFDVILAFITGLGEAIKNNAKALREAINTLVTDILDAICEFLGIHSPSTKFKEIAGNMIDGLIEGFVDFASGAIEEVKGFFEDIITTIKGFFKKFKTKGGEIITKIKDGFVDKFKTAHDKMSSIMSGIINVISNKYSDFKKKGGELITKLAKGISDSLSSIKETVKTLINGAVEKIKEFFSDFTEIGEYLIDGLIDGIASGAKAVKNKVEEIGSDIINGVKDVFGIASPSKVFAQIGRYLDEGLIVGLEDKAKNVVDATENVGDMAVKGMAGVSQRISDIINSDVDINPTIKPVIDLTDIADGANTINDLLNADRTLALAGNTNMQMNGKLSADLPNKRMDINNDDVVNELRSLRGEMGEMAASIQKMKIVMDTNALVGAIAGPMDRNLGRRTVIKGRGV